MQTAISNPHGNHKLKIYNRYTQIKKKESKHNSNGSHQITGEQKRKGRKVNYKNKCKTINKLAVKNIHIGNYLKCKQIKCPNQKTHCVEGCKIKTRGNFPGG